MNRAAWRSRRQHRLLPAACLLCFSFVATVPVAAQSRFAEGLALGADVSGILMGGLVAGMYVEGTLAMDNYYGPAFFASALVVAGDALGITAAATDQRTLSQRLRVAQLCTHSASVGIVSWHLLANTELWLRDGTERLGYFLIAAGTTANAFTTVLATPTDRYRTASEVIALATDTVAASFSAYVAATALTTDCSMSRPSLDHYNHWPAGPYRVAGAAIHAGSSALGSAAYLAESISVSRTLRRWQRIGHLCAVGVHTASAIAGFLNSDDGGTYAFEAAVVSAIVSMNFLTSLVAGASDTR